MVKIINEKINEKEVWGKNPINEEYSSRDLDSTEMNAFYDMCREIGVLDIGDNRNTEEENVHFQVSREEDREFENARMELERQYIGTETHSGGRFQVSRRADETIERVRTAEPVAIEPPILRNSRYNPSTEELQREYVGMETHISGWNTELEADIRSSLDL